MANALSELMARNALAQPMNTIRASSGEYITPQGGRSKNPVVFGQSMPGRNSLLLDYGSAPVQLPDGRIGYRTKQNPNLVVGKNGEWQFDLSIVPKTTKEMIEEANLRKLQLGNEATETQLRGGKPIFSAELGGFVYSPTPENPQGRIVPMAGTPGFKPKPKLSAGESAVDKNFAKEYVSWNAMGGKSDVEKNLLQLADVRKQLEESGNLTGFVAGNIPNWALPMANPQALAAKEAVEEVVQRNLRLILGAQFTEKEGTRLIERAYNPKLPESENVKRLGRLMKAIEEAAIAKDSASQYYEENGTLKGWKGKLFNMADFKDAIDNPTAPQQPIGHARAGGGFSDAEKEARYQAWKKQQGL